MRGAVMLIVLLVAGCSGAPKAAPPAAAEPTGTPTMVCPSGLVPADLRLPERGEIRLNVLNATGVEGVERAVFVELGKRDFQMISSTGGLGASNEVAAIRYGPRTVGAAWVMRSFFIDDVTMIFDIERPDDTVDVILGRKFVNLATVTEVNRRLAQLGQPTAPPGTCAA